MPKGRKKIKIRLLKKGEFQKLYNEAINQGKTITKQEIETAKRTGKINLSNRPITDLSPLKELRLMEVNLENTDVTNLNPLKGMPIEYINIHGTKIKDISMLNKETLVAIKLNKYITNLKGFTLITKNIGSDNIKGLPSNKILRLKTMDIVEVKNEKQKREINEENKEIYKKTLRLAKVVEIIQYSKKGTKRECITFEDALGSKTLCIGNNKIRGKRIVIKKITQNTAKDHTVTIKYKTKNGTTTEYAKYEGEWHQRIKPKDK